MERSKSNKQPNIEEKKSNVIAMWWKEMHIPVYLYLSETSINFVHLFVYTFTHSFVRSCKLECADAAFLLYSVVIFSFSIQLRFPYFRGSIFFFLYRCHVLAFMLSTRITYVFTVSNTHSRSITPFLPQR